MIPPNFDNEHSPTVFHRVGSLLMGGAYLAYLSGGAYTITGTSLWLTTLLVMAGAVAIMAVLAACGVKLERQRGPVRRFSLSTVFLITIPLSIYLAAIRWMLQAASREPLTTQQWLAIGIASAAFMLLTTVMLLYLADALMWLAVAVQRRMLRRADRRIPTSRARDPRR